MAFTILVVDDHPEDRKVIRDLLQHEPALAGKTLRVVEAQDGVEGLAVFRRERPDLVITDLQLPRVDGYGLCHAIRDLPQGKQVALIAMSALHKDAAVTKQLGDNFGAEFLSKPIQPRHLAARVLEVLRRTGAAAPPRVAPKIDPMDATGPGWPPEALPRQAAALGRLSLKTELVDRTGRPPDASRRVAPKIDPMDTTGPGWPPDAALAPEPMEIRTPDQAPVSPGRRFGSPAVAAPVLSTPSPLNLSRAARTTLDKHSVSWLLVQAAAASSTGSLRLVRGKVRRVIFFVGGSPVYVDSNLRNETLGYCLVSKKIITEEQLSAGLKGARADGEKLGEALVHAGITDEATVAEALAGQVRLKLVNAMRWPDGTASFVPGDDFSARVPQCPVDGVELALLVLKKTSRSLDLPAQWEPFLDQAMCLTPLGERFRSTVERAFGTSLLRQLLTGTALRQALGRLADPAAMLVLLETLRVTGLGELSSPLPDAIVLEPVVESEDSSAPTEFRDLDPTVPRHQSGVIELAELELVDPGEQPPHVAPWESGKAHALAADVELEEPPGSAPASPPAAEPRPRDGSDASSGTEVSPGLRAALLTAYAEVHEKNFYQVLEVAHDASPAQVERAYRQALSRFSLEPRGGAEVEEENEKVTELCAIAEQAYTILSDPARRRGYDETLALAEVQPEPNRDAFGAELLFQEGQALLRGRDFAAAVRAFEAAVRAHPGQPDYHASLGWAVFLARGRGDAGAVAARPHLEEALSIAPDSAQVHELCGHVELEVQEHERAVDHFASALRAGAPRLELFQRLRDLLLRLGRFEELEQQYRQLIFRLRDSDPLGTVPLWLELSSLYAHRLGQAENARVALEVAARMAPDDARVPRASAALTIATGGEWHEHARLHAQRFLAAPDDVTPLRELARLHLAGGRPRPARDALAVLSLCGAVRPEHEQLLIRLRPTELRRAGRPLESAELEALAGGEPPAVVLEALVALAPVLGHLAPLTPEMLGASASGRLAEEAMPRAFAAVLAYVCLELRIPVPAIYPSRSLVGKALPVVDETPALVVGEDVIGGQDDVATAAALALGTSCLDVGRCLLLTRSVEDLKDIVMAGLSLFNQNLRLVADTRAATWRQALQNASAWHEVLRPPLQGLMAARRVNLSEARRATERWAARVALLLSTDLPTVIRLLGGELETGMELASFALGEDYERLRQALALPG